MGTNFIMLVFFLLFAFSFFMTYVFLFLDAQEEEGHRSLRCRKWAIVWISFNLSLGLLGIIGVVVFDFLTN